MKKVIKPAQPAKVEVNTEMQAPNVYLKKQYLQHKAFDHSHGRINKNPFGINHEPGCF